MASSLRICSRSSPALQEILEQAAELTKAGMGLCDALDRWQERFPPFFLPVLRCGEETGRQDAALAYLERHCRLLAGPARTKQNTWRVPLGVLLGGSVICGVAHLLLAPLPVTFAYILHTMGYYGVLAAFLAVAFWVPQAKRLVDGLKLVLPVIGPAERELAMSRFFHAMSLLYSTNGRRVEQMIRLAAESSDNIILRRDFVRAAAAVESGATIAEAFAIPSTIPCDLKSLVSAGDEAGKLEDAFDAVARTVDESVQHRLRLFQQLFFRVVASSVVFSVAMTLYSLLAIPG